MCTRKLGMGTVTSSCTGRPAIGEPCGIFKDAVVAGNSPSFFTRRAEPVSLAPAGEGVARPLGGRAPDPGAARKPPRLVAPGVRVPLPEGRAVSQSGHGRPVRRPVHVGGLAHISLLKAGPTANRRGGSPPGHRASGPRASPPGGVEGFGVAGVDATSGSGSPKRSRAGGAGFGGSVTTGSGCACCGPLAFSRSTVFVR